MIHRSRNMRSSCIVALALLASHVLYAQSASRTSRSGAKSFQVYCHKCHSTDATRSLAPSLYHVMSSKRLSESQMRNIITQGKNTMPPFNRRLRARELDRLLEYLKTL